MYGGSFTLLIATIYQPVGTSLLVNLPDNHNDPEVYNLLTCSSPHRVEVLLKRAKERSHHPASHEAIR